MRVVLKLTFNLVIEGDHMFNVYARCNELSSWYQLYNGTFEFIPAGMEEAEELETKYQAMETKAPIRLIEISPADLELFSRNNSIDLSHLDY